MPDDSAYAFTSPTDLSKVKRKTEMAFRNSSLRLQTSLYRELGKEWQDIPPLSVAASIVSAIMNTIQTDAKICFVPAWRRKAETHFTVEEMVVATGRVASWISEQETANEEIRKAWNDTYSPDMQSRPNRPPTVERPSSLPSPPLELMDGVSLRDNFSGYDESGSTVLPWT